MNQVLVQAGLIASEDKIQAELVQSTLAQAGLSAEKQKAILIEANLMDATTGEIIATKACTKEELLNALAKKGITGANAEAIISTLGLAGANETATLSFSLFTKAVWANIKAIGIWLLTNPVGWFTLLAGATVGTALVLKQFNTTLDDAGKTLSEQNEKFKSLSDEVTTLGDELKTTKDRIKELEGLPSLTIVEDEELQKLKDTTAELEYQLAIKKEEQRIEAEKTAKAASDAYNASFQRMYDGNGELITSPTNENWNPVQELKNTMKAYEAYKKSYDELQTKITQDSEAGKNTSKDQKRLSNIKKQMTSIEEHAKEMADVVNDQKEAYEGLYAAGFDVQGNDLAIYEEVRDGTEAYQEFCNTLNDTTKAYSELSNEEKRQLILSKAVLGGKTKEEAQKIVDSISDEDLEFVGQIHFNRESTIQSVHDEIDAIKSEANSYGSGNKTDIFSFSDAWEQLKNSTEDATKGLADNLTELAEKGQLTVEALSEADTTDFFKNVGISAEEAVKKINELVSASTQLQSMSAQISKMSDMLSDKKNGTIASASDFAGFDAEVRGLDSWKEFESVMGSTTSTMEECQVAANALATEWINNGNFLANLTEQNRDYYENQLKNMGIENAHVIILENLAKAGYELSDAEQAELDKAIQAREEIYALQLQEAQDFIAKKDLNVAAQDAYAGLLQEAEGAGISKVALIDLIAQEQVFSNSGLSVSSKISELSALASAYLGTAAAAQFAANTSVSGMGSDSRYFTPDYVMDQWTGALSNYKVNFDISSSGSSGYKGSSSKSSGSSSKSKSSKDTTKSFDLIEIYINRISRAIDKLNKKVSNTWNSWSDRNKALKQELNKVLELQTAQEKAAKYYKKKANKITLSSDKKKDAKLKEQLRNGAIDIKTVKDEKLAEKMQQYLDYWDKVKEYTDAAADSFEQYQSLVVQKFEQIQAKYDARIGYQENRKNAVQDALDLAEAKGQNIGSAYYTKQMGINDKEIKKYKNEEKELIKAMADVPKYSEQWYEMKDAISQVKSSYVQLEIENANLQKSINDLKFDRFDDLIDKLDDVVDETNFLIDMLDSDNLFDKNGMITDDGITAMGLTAQNYDTYLAKAERYKSQIAELEAMYNNGDIGYEYYQAKLREYKSGQQSAIKSANEAKKAVIDYVREGLEKQNQVLEEAVSKQKELLKSEQDLYNFQRKIADQNKNIAGLRKQLNALEGDSSEEARKRKQLLKSQLADAEQEQKDTLYDRSVEDAEKSLNELVENSQKQAEDYLSNSEKVFMDALNYVNTHSYQVSQNLEKISKDTGYSISENISNAWKGAGNAVDTYESILSGNVPKITMQIDAITTKWNEAAKAAKAAAKASASAAAGKDESAGDNGSSDNSSPKLTQVRKYIESHMNKASQKPSYYGSLNRYIYDRTGGYVLSKAEEVALAKMLGVSVKDDLSGKNDRDNILQALKNVGWGTTLRKLQLAKFATGGTIGKAINQSGEDGIVLARTGEEVLSIEKIKELGKSFQMINPVLDNLKTIIPTNQIVPRQQPMEVNIDNRVTVEGVATDQIVKDFEKVAQKQAENTIAKINSLTYAKGVRR